MERGSSLITHGFRLGMLPIPGLALVCVVPMACELTELNPASLNVYIFPLNHSATSYRVEIDFLTYTHVLNYSL